MSSTHDPLHCSEDDDQNDPLRDEIRRCSTEIIELLTSIPYLGTLSKYGQN